MPRTLVRARYHERMPSTWSWGQRPEVWTDEAARRLLFDRYAQTGCSLHEAARALRWSPEETDRLLDHCLLTGWQVRWLTSCIICHGNSEVDIEDLTERMSCPECAHGQAVPLPLYLPVE